TRSKRDWSSDVCSSDLEDLPADVPPHVPPARGHVRGGAVDGRLRRAQVRPARAGGVFARGVAVRRRGRGGGGGGRRLAERPPVRSEERRVGKECGWWCA